MARVILHIDLNAFFASCEDESYEFGDLIAPSNLKVMGGELCPRTGYWVLSSQKEKRLYFTKGTLIPKYNKDWGEEYWVFDGEA